MSEITVESLSLAFGDNQVLDDVSFTLSEHEFLTLLGPSGCGKTTTLMSVAGFLRPDAGEIRSGEVVFFDGARRRFLEAEHRNLGMVFQSYAIWPHMTVFDNVAFPLRTRRTAKAEIRSRVTEVLSLVEMADFADRYPHQISGGQQQRVALARALVYSPSVLLLDEPFSNLDAKLRERARTWLKRLQTELGLTCLFVTHDQDEALSLSDRIIVMDHGRILQTGAPETIYRRPEHRFVAEFIGHCTVLSGRVEEVAGPVARVRVGEALVISVPSEGAAAGASVDVVVRPEDVSLDGADARTVNVFDAQVTASAFLGDHYEHELTIAGQPLGAVSSHAVPGSAVSVHIPVDAFRTLHPSDRTPIRDTEMSTR